jgi:inorganic pyrophosphatase
MNKLFSFYPNIKTFSEHELTEDRIYIYFHEKSHRISPWHDIPYKNDDNTINMICEIPRYTRKKFEIETKINNNPIVQDQIDSKLREYKYGDMLFNYGAIPRTWEDPNILCEETLKYGDNDPLDIIDIGDTQAQTGFVYKVKPIGILALIDDGETDWKVISINIMDQHADNIDNLESVEQYKPGCLAAIKYWFEHYKTARGKNRNQFAFGGKYRDMKYTHLIIEKCHQMWQKINEVKEKFI